MNLTELWAMWTRVSRNRKAKAMPAGYIDILVLHRKGLVTARGTGQSIREVSVEIINRTEVPLKIAIAHGTYFVSRGNHQNMVTRRTYEFELPPMGSKSIHVPATCINANLPIPTSKDRFSGVAQVSPKVQRFLKAAQGEDAMVVQAGVWALTDGYTRQKIQATLRTRTSSPTFGASRSPIASTDRGPAISDAQIDKAKKILTGLGIGNNL